MQGNTVGGVNTVLIQHKMRRDAASSATARQAHVATDCIEMEEAIDGVVKAVG